MPNPFLDSDTPSSGKNPFLDTPSKDAPTDAVRSGYRGVADTLYQGINDVGGAIGKGVSAITPQPVKDAASGVGDYLKNKNVATAPLYHAVKDVGIPMAKREINDLSQYNSDLKPDLKAFGKNAQAAAAMPAVKPVGELAEAGAIKGFGKAREAVNAKSDAMGKGANISARPMPDSLLKGAGGTPYAASPKAISGAHGILQTALKEDGINPLDIAQKLEEARATGLPVTAADVMSKEVGGVQTHGKNSLGLLKGAANMPGPGASMAGEVASRGANATKRIGNALDIAFTNKGVYEVSDAALEKMQTETPKAYATAFEGGSIAPLEKQFERGFQDAAAKVSAAQQKVAEANQNLLQIEAKKQTNANVYVDSGLIGEKRKAIENLQKAQKSLAKAQENENGLKEMMRQAQSDRKNGVKGAVWSPRIQEILADDTVQNGIKKGLWIAKKEALANGEKFNPTEYGITGYAENGDPIVSKVPNMRMLDAGKKGLDAIINENKNDLTGKMNETGRAVSMLKNAYVKEIDSLNPDYAKARASYGDQASQLQALKDGRNFTRMDKEEISRFMKDPNVSKAEKTAFATGVRRKLQEILDEDPTNPTRQIWKTGIRDKLESVFSSKDVADKFGKLIEHEQSMSRINGALATGSHTNQLGNYQKTFSAPSRMLKAVTNPTGAAVDFGMESISNKMRNTAANMSKEQAAVVSRYLTTNDPQLWYDLAFRMEEPE